MTYYPEPDSHIRDKVKVIFLDSTKLKIVWISHNNCLGHTLIT